MRKKIRKQSHLPLKQQKNAQRCKKAKLLPVEPLQTAEKRREVKGKGEKERYTHLNAEFQRKARSGKKKTPSLSEQCKEIEENNRMGQTRDLFKKIRETIRYQREHFRQRWAQ